MRPRQVLSQLQRFCADRFLYCVQPDNLRLARTRLRQLRRVPNHRVLVRGPTRSTTAARVAQERLALQRTKTMHQQKRKPMRKPKRLQIVKRTRAKPVRPIAACFCAHCVVLCCVRREIRPVVTQEGRKTQKYAALPWFLPCDVRVLQKRQKTMTTRVRACCSCRLLLTRACCCVRRRERRGLRGFDQQAQIKSETKYHCAAMVCVWSFFRVHQIPNAKQNKRKLSPSRRVSASVCRCALCSICFPFLP